LSQGDDVGVLVCGQLVEAFELGCVSTLFVFSEEQQIGLIMWAISIHKKLMISHQALLECGSLLIGSVPG
jgi:hypothetical protein